MRQTLFTVPWAAVSVALVLAGVSAHIEIPPDLCITARNLGVDCEHINATTADGFVLDVIHLPAKNASSSLAQPVILQHGLYMTAGCYFANAKPEQNLATILHAQGYDVFLPNSRGNHYSLTNADFPARNATFWRIVDLDEMAAFDVPAVIDAVLAHSHATTAANASTVVWVGHSQGTAMMFAGMSLPARSYAAKVSLFVALAPVAFSANKTAPISVAMCKYHVAEKQLAEGHYFALENDAVFEKAAAICPVAGTLCPLVMGGMFGWGNMSNFDPALYPAVSKYTPGGTSSSNLIHWCQGTYDNDFAMHDFGPVLNEKYYHSPKPPQYPLGDFPVSLPTVLVTGGVDGLADPVDVARLRAALPAGAVRKVIHEDNYAHMDFVWGLDAHVRIYPQITALIASYARQS